MTDQRVVTPRREVPASDEYSLALGRVVARRLTADSQRVRAIGWRNLSHASDIHGSTAKHWIDRWTALLDGDDAALVRVLTSPDEAARALRQNSPFAGVLTPSERWAVLSDVRRTRRASRSA